MRFTTTLLAVLPALSLFTPVLAHWSRPDGNALAAISNKYNTESKGRKNYSPCANYRTRDPKLCTCLGDTVEPVNWYQAKSFGRRDFDGDFEHELEKRTFGRGQCGDWPKQECVCPDAPNTFLEFKRNTPVCSCPGNKQKFDSNIDECVCKDGFDAKRKQGNYLTCKPPKPPTPTPSGYPVRQQRRTFNEAVTERRDGVESRTLESLLGCGTTERACEAYGSWTCTNIMTSVQTCGGCAEEAVDCAALPNVDTVSCVAGGCVIDTCARGFELNKSTTQGECVANSTGSWFNVQA